MSSYQGENAGRPPSQASSCPQTTTSDAAVGSAFIVIPPNEERRRKVTDIASRETEEFERYKQNKKPTQFSFVGTCGDGRPSTVDEYTARQKQAQQNSRVKTEKRLKEEERRRQMKKTEESQYEEKKAAAREKAKLNELREEKRQQTLRPAMEQMKNAFLEKMEAKATRQPPQPSGRRH